MNINTIKECMTLALEGKITFPETVKKLVADQTERYIADLVGLQKLYFGINGETYAWPLNFNPIKVAQQFDIVKVKSAIRDSQQSKINYPTFLQRIMEAGCCHYEVFLTGKKVIYFGRDGSNHIEFFPQPNNDRT